MTYVTVAAVAKSIALAGAAPKPGDFLFFPKGVYSIKTPVVFYVHAVRDGIGSKKEHPRLGVTYTPGTFYQVYPVSTSRLVASPKPKLTKSYLIGDVKQWTFSPEQLKKYGAYPISAKQLVQFALDGKLNSGTLGMKRVVKPTPEAAEILKQVLKTL